MYVSWVMTGVRNWGNGAGHGMVMGGVWMGVWMGDGTWNGI